MENLVSFFALLHVYCASSNQQNIVSSKLMKHVKEKEETTIFSLSSESNIADCFDDDINTGICCFLSSCFSHISRQVRVDNKNSTLTSYSLELDSTKLCSICLECYREGEKICCSKNKKCDHFFHLDCITNWLFDHDGCPLCRENYLSPPE